MNTSANRFQDFEKQLDQDINSQRSAQPITRRAAFGAIFLGLLVSVVVLLNIKNDAASSSSLNTKSSNVIKKNQFNGDEQSSLSFTLRRVGYDALEYWNPSYSSHLTYPFLASYKAVIEPSVAMELYIYNQVMDASSPAYEYTVCPTDSTNTDDCQQGTMYYDSSSGVSMSSSVTFSCSTYSTYSISVYTLDSTTKEVKSVSTGNALCLYVRREIRSYSSADMEKFLDASYTLNAVSQTEGEALYGDNYQSSSNLVKLHYFNAGQRDSDHIHEGNGFITQHLKLTNIFETSLQSVDSSLALPYWDFTVDNASNHLAFDSFVMTSDMFGALTYPKGDDAAFFRPENSVEDARISSGRWKDLKAEMNTEFPTLKAGFGYMRAPWSMNPSPYVSRYAFNWSVEFGILPSCYYHYSMLEYTSLMDYFYDISFGSHGTAHTTIGGIFGCDAMEEMLTLGYFSNKKALYNACSYMGNSIKEAYRQGYLDVRKNCTVNESDYTASECRYQCLSDAKAETAAEVIYTILEDNFSDDANTTEIKQYLKNWACGGTMSEIFVGDHYEAASPSDPSFWVMHPTLERLTHAKLMSGGFLNEAWATNAKTDFVCSKGSCYKEDIDESDYFPDCCYGHYENDQMFNGYSASRASYFGSTNGEMLTATDPRSSSYSVNYIYDKFSWSHCPDTGYDIDSLLVELYDESKDTSSETREARKNNAMHKHLLEIKSSMAEKTRSVFASYKQRKEAEIAKKNTAAAQSGK